MHPAIVDNLEEYISGNLLPAALREFEAHLQTCPACREEVRGIEETSSMFAALRPEEDFAPPPGFAALVMQRVAAEAAPSFWSLFTLDPWFGRRVVFASLVLLAVLGSFLVSRESEYAPGPSPEAVMAIDQASPHRAAGMNDRDMMLVTLTSYEP